jgi:hypothetical protein
MSENQRLPKLKQTGKTEELLKENETDISHINHLTYVAATVIITETITKPDKTEKDILNKDSWKIRI